VCNVVQRIPGNRASLHNGLPSKEKADPVFPGSAAICCCCALPQELVGAIQSGFKSPLPHHRSLTLTLVPKNVFRHSAFARRARPSGTHPRFRTSL
jgi:hypothetical protein